MPGFDKARNKVPQIVGGVDTGAAPALATQGRAPELPLGEPRARGGHPVEGDCGPLGRTPVQDRVFLMLAGVVHNQMPTTVGGADAPRAQELTTLQIGRASRALGEDFPGADRKGGKEGEGAMANILKLLAFDQPRRQGQRRRQAFQGLEVGLLVETEHPPAPQCH